MVQHTADKLTMAERLTEGAAVSIMGFLIVFTVLLVIMIILSIFNFFAKRAEKKAEQAAVETPVLQTPQPEAQTVPDDTQLVAVITAAIMAARQSGNEGTDGLVIKSIRRVNSWNKEALAEQNIGY